jgi:hypothetical protein
MGGNFRATERTLVSCLLDGCLQPAEALTRGLLGVLVTLPLVFGFQAGPLIRINRLEVGSLVVAIGCALRREQRWIDAVNWRRRMPALFGRSTDMRRDADSGRLDLRWRRIGLALH